MQNNRNPPARLDRRLKSHMMLHEYLCLNTIQKSAITSTAVVKNLLILMFKLFDCVGKLFKDTIELSNRGRVYRVFSLIVNTRPNYHMYCY